MQGQGAVLVQPDIDLYRDQLAEVDRDLARDVIAAAEAARLRIEVSRRLLAASKTAPKPADWTETSALPMGLIAAAVAGSFALYLLLGTPDMLDLPLHKRLDMARQAYDNRPSQMDAEQQTPAPQVAVDAEMAALVAQLRDVVAKRPKDIQGLTLLAQNEARLGNYRAASAAYAQLIAAKGAGELADHLGAAQAMIAATNGYVSPQAESHLTAALQLDPENGMARYFMGLMLAQTGRPDRAFALWEPLLRQGPPDALYIEPLRALLPQLAAEAGIRYELPSGPTAQDVANAAQMTAADRQEMIQTMVEGLETRLMTQGGSLEDWLKLINALDVLNAPARKAAAQKAAQQAFAQDPAALRALTP